MLRGAVRDFLKLHPDNAAIKKNRGEGVPMIVPFSQTAVVGYKGKGVDSQHAALP